jgi:hypothetical protein
MLAGPEAQPGRPLQQAAMRAAIALLALLAAAPATAGQVAAPARPAADAPGPPVIRVNIVGSRPDGTPDDRRGTLARLRTQLGLSPAEAARIRASTGIVLCDEDEDGLRPLASAVLVGDGTAIVTAAHVLRDPKKGWAALPAGTRCLFRNQAARPEAVPLRIDRTEILGAGGRGNLWDPNDYAVVRLARPLATRGAVPFPIAEAPDAPGTPVLLISGFQTDLEAKLGRAEPIAQQARIERAGQAEDDAPRPLYLAGAMAAGGSGGAMLVRSRGRLALAAIVSSTGAISRNGFPFSLRMRSFIRVIAVNGRFRAAIEARALARAATPANGSCRIGLC